MYKKIEHAFRCEVVFLSQGIDRAMDCSAKAEKNLLSDANMTIESKMNFVSKKVLSVTKERFAKLYIVPMAR